MIYTIANTVQIGKPVKVFVGDNRIERAVYADTVRGIVKYHPEPVRIKKNSDEIYTRTLRGEVRVVTE